MHGLPDNAAWLSNHFSEEPTDAIISEFLAFTFAIAY